MDFTHRVAIHAALGEPSRLEIVDALTHSDASVSDLRTLTGLEGNALAHHLGVLEDVGLVSRHRSEGDARRKYLRLNGDLLDALDTGRQGNDARSVVFVCTHNSARSQFAAAQWEATTGARAVSVGSDPAEAVNALAVDVAAEFGLDISTATPRGYASIVGTPDLVVSVCDRAHEGGIPHGVQSLHWSTPDPVAVGSKRAFRSAFADIAQRIDRLASQPA